MRIGSACRAVVWTAAWFVCTATTVSAATNPRDKAPVSWDVRLAPADEPGEPFEMWGTALDAQSKPIPGAKLFVYHADSAGQYARGSGAPLRLAATLRTNEHGRYRIRSVFPGGYGGFPAHVHYEYLSPSFAAGFLNVSRQGSRDRSGEVAVPRDSDGVWRLHVNLTPYLRGRSTSSALIRGNGRSEAPIDWGRWWMVKSAPRDTVRSPR
jgi:hypothetical protein